MIFQIFLTGGEWRIHAEKVCSNVRTALESRRVSLGELGLTLQALFKTQPVAALDTFLPSPHFRSSPLTVGMPVESVDHAVLRQWADRDPDTRYPWIARHIAMFDEVYGDEQNAFSPLFEAMLSNSPNKREFLDQYRERLIPSDCFGSTAGSLTFRKAQLVNLADRTGGQLSAWVDDLISELDPWIARIRGRDRRAEESFE